MTMQPTRALSVVFGLVMLAAAPAQTDGAAKAGWNVWDDRDLALAPDTLTCAGCENEEPHFTGLRWETGIWVDGEWCIGPMDFMDGPGCASCATWKTWYEMPNCWGFVGETGTQAETNAWHDDNNCDAIHCEIEALMNEAIAAAAASSGAELRRLLLNGSGRLYVNTERGALQGLGCNGQVALHIALPKGLIADFTATEP
jgi:hypothetical protein